MIFIGNHLRLIEIGRGPEVSFGACVDDARLSRCINAMHLEDVLGDIQTDCANLRVDDPSDVVRCQRSPSGTSMPREGVVHYIKLGCLSDEKFDRLASESAQRRSPKQAGRRRICRRLLLG